MKYSLALLMTITVQLCFSQSPDQKSQQILPEKLELAKNDLDEATTIFGLEINRSLATVFSAVFQAVTLLIVTILGSIFAYRNNKTVNQQNRLELLVESLKWFEGRAQKRSIGIAMVIEEWDEPKNIHLRNRWMMILVNQCIRIMTRGKEQDTPHDLSNLYLMLYFIVENKYYLEYRNLRYILFNTLISFPTNKRGVRGLSEQKKEKWISELKIENSEKLKDYDMSNSV